MDQLLEKIKQLSEELEKSNDPKQKNNISLELQNTRDQFIKLRARNWNIDVVGRLEWIDSCTKIINQAKRSWHETH